MDETVALAQEAERLGFSEVWLPESSHGRGVFTVAASLAAKTSAIKIGIGVVNPFWRHPSLIAMEAAALDEAAGAGRVKLGVGAALWTLRALGEADPRTDKPLTAMVEALRIIRAMLRGEPIDIEPTIFAARKDAHLDFAPTPRGSLHAGMGSLTPRPPIPVYAGAVNARMLRAAGAWSDGVQLGAAVSPGYVASAWRQIAHGATDAGRDPRDLDLASNVLVSVGRDVRAARDAVKEVLAYYLHRVEKVVLDTSGADPEELARIAATVRTEGVPAGAALISDSIVDTFAAAGTPDHVAERLDAFTAAGLRGVLAWHVLGPDRAEALRLLADEVRPRVFN